MATEKKLNVIMIADSFDGNDVGEALMAYNWAREMSQIVNLTAICLQRKNQKPISDLLSNAEVVCWTEYQLPNQLTKMNSALKPQWMTLYTKTRAWIKKQQSLGRRFHLGHQLTPIAARYPTPFVGLNIPFIVGPVGGSLTTPSELKDSPVDEPWFHRLRTLDQFRWKYDPLLRSTFTQAEAVIVVGEYMKNNLAQIPIKRFETMLELGIEKLPQATIRRNSNEIRLLHVGRGVRTKGLRETIYALEKMAGKIPVTLTSIGEGKETEICKTICKEKGLDKNVNFLGRIPHRHVQTEYEKADIFVFPSFREPTGGVIYEAMSHGLPVISVNYGGPSEIINEDTGILIELDSSEKMATAIAKQIDYLVENPNERFRLGNNAREELRRSGLWRTKAARLLKLYEEIANKEEVS